MSIDQYVEFISGISGVGESLLEDHAEVLALGFLLLFLTIRNDIWQTVSVVK